jgi:hypothetical protein
MVDQLLKYVEEQFGRGYSPKQVKDTLLRNGYSPALVDGVIESVGKRGLSSSSLKTRGADMSSFTPKIFLVVFIAALLIGGGVFLAFFLKGDEALLDVVTIPDREIVHPSEAVGFELQVANMGSTKRVDMSLKYSILDDSDNLIISKEDTLAVETSLIQHKEVKLPATAKPGHYTLKVFVNYDDNVATASFDFKVEKKEATTVKGSCDDGLKNQDEVGVDCGGVCGGYFYDGSCNDNPKQANPVTPIQPDGKKGTCTDEVKNQDEVGVDCGGVCGGYWYDLGCHDSPKSADVSVSQKSTGSQLMDIRTVAKSDPESAKESCFGFIDEKVRDTCIKSVAQISKNSEYCELIISDSDRDLCYYPFFMQGDYVICEKLVLKESLQTCAQLRQIDKLSKEPPFLPSTVEQEEPETPLSEEVTE